MTGEDDTSNRLDSLDLYKVHVDEYRFQVRLNWERVRYFVGLVALLLSAGVGLLKLESGGSQPLTALVFLAGCAVAWLAVQVLATQTDYYRSARDRMALVAERLDLGALALRTTPAMGSSRVRRLRISQAVRGVLTPLGIVNLLGLLYVLATWLF